MWARTPTTFNRIDTSHGAKFFSQHIGIKIFYHRRYVSIEVVTLSGIVQYSTLTHLD